MKVEAEVKTMFELSGSDCDNVNIRCESLDELRDACAWEFATYYNCPYHWYLSKVQVLSYKGQDFVLDDSEEDIEYGTCRRDVKGDTSFMATILDSDIFKDAYAAKKKQEKEDREKKDKEERHKKYLELQKEFED